TGTGWHGRRRRTWWHWRRRPRRWWHGSRRTAAQHAIAMHQDFRLHRLVALTLEVGPEHPLATDVDVDVVPADADGEVGAGRVDGELGKLGAGHASDLDVGRLPCAVTAVRGLLSALRIHRLVARP